MPSMHCLPLLLLILVVSVTPSAIFNLNQAQHQAYSSWKSQFSRVYQNSEVETFRLTLWLQTYNKIQEHNANYKEGLVSYFVGLNDFSDKAQTQLNQWYYTFPYEADYVSLCAAGPTSVPSTLPSSHYHSSTLTQYNQNPSGNCGSGWAMASSFALSVQYGAQVRAPKNETAINLSPQQLVDCTTTTTYGSSGCGGGSVFTSWKYFKDVGSVTNYFYPYTGVGASCNSTAVSKSPFQIASCVAVMAYSQPALRLAVTNAPVVVQINANSFGFVNYAGGIYNAVDCEPTEINHAVVVIGYDYEVIYVNGVPQNSTFWMLTNSFGSGWGESGMMRIAREENDISFGPCGMHVFPSYAIL